MEVRTPSKSRQPRARRPDAATAAVATPAAAPGHDVGRYVRGDEPAERHAHGHPHEPDERRAIRGHEEFEHATGRCSPSPAASASRSTITTGRWESPAGTSKYSRAVSSSMNHFLLLLFFLLGSHTSCRL